MVKLVEVRNVPHLVIYTKRIEVTYDHEEQRKNVIKDFPWLARDTGISESTQRNHYEQNVPGFGANEESQTDLVNQQVPTPGYNEDGEVQIVESPNTWL